MKQTKDVPIDKVLVFWHIVAYFFVVAALICQSFFLNTKTQGYEISTYVLLGITLVCSSILAAIVNNILTKFLQSQPS